MSDDTEIKLQNVSGNQQSVSGSSNNYANDSYSIYYSQYTQEDNENTIDVMWDWHSPQSKPRIRKHKQDDIQQSPKLPIKRHTSNNQINNFNKLREELETLRDHIVESIDTSAVPNAKHSTTNINPSNLEDMFNDSMDEQLLFCSQEAENKCANEKPDSLKYLDKTLHPEKTLVTVVKNHNNNKVNNSFTNTNNNTKTDYLKNDVNKIADDSFDFILGTLKDEDLEFNDPLTAVGETVKTTDCKINKECSIAVQSDIPKCTAEEIARKRKESLAKLEAKNKDQLYSAKPSCSIPAQSDIFKYTTEEIERKKKESLAKLEAKNKDQYSAKPLCYIPAQGDISKCTAEEIERKRKESLAKLEAKKKQIVYEDAGDSPIKCSPEEIEQKRLQAKAKLEAKQKDIIERNRQQARKRLEENKRRRALHNQTSLPRKIHNTNI